MSVDALRLRAEGVPVPTKGESEAVLRFSLLALSVLESDFGSVNRAWQSFQACGHRDDEGLALDLDRDTARTIARFLRAGLAAPGNILTADEAAEFVEMTPANSWLAIQAALFQAFPEPSGKAAAEEATSSTGPGSTTPQPSAGDAPTPSSGT